MSTAISITESYLLLPAQGEFVVVVTPLAKGVTGRTLVITQGMTTVLNYVDGIVSTDAGYNVSVTATSEDISVTVSPVAPLASGTVRAFTATYTDPATPIIGVSSTFSYGTVNVTTQYPAPEAPFVNPQTEVTLVATSNAPYTFTGGELRVNGVTVDRPDVIKRQFISASLFAGDYALRRAFNENTRAKVEIRIALTPDGVTTFYAPVSWSFHVNKRSAIVLNSAVETAEVVRPHLSAAYEIFRRAMFSEMVRADTTTPFLTLLFDAVNRSGLASLRITLPYAEMVEREKVLDTEIPDYSAIYNKLLSLTLFWEPLLISLTESGAMTKERASLLNRAWTSQNAIDVVAAVCIALIHGASILP